MFYLKYVLLEMMQEGQEGGCMQAAGEASWERSESWQAWISSLKEMGIQVLTRTMYLKNPTNVSRAEAVESEGAAWAETFELEAEGCGGQKKQACLWITDDAKRAWAYARKGLPVMGVLRERNSELQSFDGVPFLVSDLTEVEPEYLEKVYRRQAGIPWEIARTKRCVIRETIPRDAKAFYEIYKDPAVTEFMEDLPKDADAFEAWLEDYTKHVYSLMEYGIWTVCLKREEEERENVFQMQDKGAARGDIEQPEQEQMMVIGRAGLTVREGYDAPELGFVIGEPWRGQGLAFEVCKAVLEYTRELELPEVIAFAEPGNTASIGLLHKLGFQEAREVFLDGRTCRMFQKS